MRGRASLGIGIALVVVAAGIGLLDPPPVPAQDPAPSWLYVTYGTEVLAVRPDGSDRVNVTQTAGRSEAHPEVSEDGQTLYLEVRPEEDAADDLADIAAIDLATGVSTDVVTDPGFQGEPSPAAGGSHLYLRDGTRLVRRDLGSGASILVAQGNDRAGNPAASPVAPGTVAYTATDDGRSQIRVVDIDAGTDVVVAPDAYLTADHAAWTPDGARLVFSCQMQVGGEFELCIAAVGDETVTVVETDEGDALTPVVAPDGTRLAWRGRFGTVLSAAPDGSDRRVVSYAGFFSDRFRGVDWGPDAPVVGGPPPQPAPPIPPPPTPPSMAPLPAGGVDGDPATTDRLDFAEPASAAIAISEARFSAATDDGEPVDGDGARQAAGHVVLSTTADFADSLAGSPLLSDGPLLFSAPERLDSATAGELTRVLAPGGTVYLLGGEAALSSVIEREVRDLGLVPRRLAGPTRFETAQAVAREVIALGGTASEVIVVRGTGTTEDPTAAWADSVTGGVYAARVGAPVLLTPSNQLHPVVSAHVEDTGAVATLLGGPAALDDVIADGLPGSRRIAGPTRAGTAARIATDLLGLDAEQPRTTLLVNASLRRGWMFGLAAGGLAADLGGALLVTAGSSLPPETEILLSSCGQPQVETLVVGSSGVIGESVEPRVDELDGSVCA